MQIAIAGPYSEKPRRYWFLVVFYVTFKSLIPIVAVYENARRELPAVRQTRRMGYR